MDRSQPVRAQQQPNDHDCRNYDDRKDNFLCRHAAPIDSWTRNLDHMLPRDCTYQAHPCIYYQ
jgi:hypothetical protein